MLNQTHFEIDCLLVEDDAICRYMMTKMLNSVARKVDVCEDAESALTLLSKKQYDIIFLDLGLPGKSGCALAQDIREKLKSAVPIVAVTGHLEQTDAQAILKKGISKIFIKPVSKDHLLAAIREFVFVSETNDS